MVATYTPNVFIRPPPLTKVTDTRLTFTPPPPLIAVTLTTPPSYCASTTSPPHPHSGSKSTSAIKSPYNHQPGPPHQIQECGPYQTSETLYPPNKTPEMGFLPARVHPPSTILRPALQIYATLRTYLISPPLPTPKKSCDHKHM